SGIVPSREWKLRNSREPWYPGETVIAGIGQGYWVATALQMARGTAAIANGGALHPLRLAAERRSGYDLPWAPLAGAPAARISDSPAHVRAVQEGMEATIHGRGTATAMARGAPYRMAGETGTAQRVSRRGDGSLDPRPLPYHLRPQALLAGERPAAAPPPRHRQPGSPYLALPPPPPGAVRGLRACGAPDHRPGGGGRTRRLRRLHRGADRAEDLRCMAAGRGAGAHRRGRWRRRAAGRPVRRRGRQRSPGPGGAAAGTGGSRSPGIRRRPPGRGRGATAMNEILRFLLDLVLRFVRPL